MPRHRRTTQGPVSIQLLQGNNFFFGDTIDGTVTIQSQEKKPTLVRIKLCARTKSKIIKKGHFSTEIYRGRVILFEANQDLTDEGTDTTETKDGGTIWPFQCPIPTSPGEGFGGNLFGLPAQSPGNNSEADVSKHELPSRFYYQSGSIFKTMEEAYVEYWIEASSTIGTATYPLCVRSGSMASPIDTFTSLIKVDQSRIVSYGLLPELTDTKLTFGQKLSESLRLNKVPRYSFKVGFKVPTTWQLNHPKHLPLDVWMTPVLDEQSTTIYNGSQDSLPVVEILNVRVSLSSKCSMRAPGAIGNHFSTMSSEHLLGQVRFNPPKVLPIVVDPWKGPASDSSPAVENESKTDPESESSSKHPNAKRSIGEIMDIFISCSGSTMRGTRICPGENQIYASFSTYNMALSYDLVVSLQLKCADKEQPIQCEAPLRLLSTSEEQARSQQVEIVDGTRKGYTDMDAACDTMFKISWGLHWFPNTWETMIAACRFAAKATDCLTGATSQRRCSQVLRDSTAPEGKSLCL